MISTIKSTIDYYAKHNFLFNRELYRIQEYYDSDSNSIELQRNNAFQSLIQQVKHNTFYKKFYDKHGVNLNQIQNLNDIVRLPILNKDLVKTNINDIKQGRKILVLKGHTSGTTGSPLVIYRDFNAIIKENAYVWWYRMQNGLLPKDKKISIRGDLNRETMFYHDKCFNTLYISSYALNKRNFKTLYSKITQFKPKAFIGYPSSLFSLALLFEDNNISLDVPLSFTSSEKLLPYQETKIGCVFGTTIYDWYGNAERTIALYKDNSKYYEPILYSINNYNDKNVLTTSLINTYFPLINYEVNDDIETQNKYSIQKKSIIIDSIGGRQEDIIILKDGSRIGRLDVVFKGVKNIKMAQIVQKNNYSIEVNIVKDNSYTDKDEQELLNNLKQKLGLDTQLNINSISKDDLIYSKSGKFSLVISKI
ncbi:phenylacetate-CoA ligase [Bizionia echini]|uniref:Phenylacetate-CoA ligase n=1 Tax=Bizionia echini TaxID=649333 RepID=A0A1I4Z8E0_9FLAO|nr:phenylacetate--CoA ligase family protein [Bizionia echini]SFN46564.1 phenylacetate-CoA ligase [Bizionia echini]